jgi:hypothetical protein
MATSIGKNGLLKTGASPKAGFEKSRFIEIISKKAPQRILPMERSNPAYR